MDDMDTGPTPATSTGKKERELTDEERIAIAVSLHCTVKNGELPHGAFTKIAKIFEVHRSTVSRIWKRAQKNVNGSLSNFDHVRSEKKNRGRPPMYFVEDVHAAMKNLPPEKRGTLRELSSNLGIPTTTVVRMMKLGEIKRVSLALKPTLTAENMFTRLMFAASRISLSLLPSRWTFTRLKRK